MSDLLNSKKIAQKYNFSPKKHFGQNFLVKKAAIKKIINSLALNKEDTIIEIGPGLGALTKKIAEKAKEVIAVEKDERAFKILKEELKNFDNLKIINKDILKLDIFLPKKYKVVANLPFYASIPIIKIFLEKEPFPEKMVFVIQKELAQRICAKPPKINSLAVFIQLQSSPSIISYISKESFWPKPEVDGAIIEIKKKKKGGIIKFNKEEKEKILKIVKAGFSQPRKKLITNLIKEYKIDKEKISSIFEKAKFSQTTRAEALSINDWLKLSKVLK